MRRAMLWPLLSMVLACTGLDLPGRAAFVGEPDPDAKEVGTDASDSAGDQAQGSDGATGGDTAGATDAADSAAALDGVDALDSVGGSDATAETADDSDTSGASDSAADSSDAAADAVTDAVGDASPDAVAETAPEDAPDATVDAGADSTADAATDAAADAAQDAAQDAAPEVPLDTTVDTNSDAALDTAVDSAVDAALDVEPDTTPDVVQDTAADAVPQDAAEVQADVAADAADAGSDAAVEVAADTASDASAPGDTGADIAADGIADAVGETVGDAEDTGPGDVTADAAADAEVDGSADAGADTGVDSSPDSGPETGGCKNAAECPSLGNSCLLPTCTGGTCGFQPLAEGATCTDGTACTSGEICSAGACVGGKAVSCNDGLSCTVDSCDSGKGCVFAATTAPCNDGNACTTGEACADVPGKGALCQGGKPVDVAVFCDDKQACTSDTCNPAKGCEHSALPGPCMGAGCMVDDACGAGQCQPGKTGYLNQTTVLSKQRINGVTGLLAGGVAVTSFDPYVSIPGVVTAYGPSGIKLWSWATSPYPYGVVTAPGGMVVVSFLQDMGLLASGTPSYVYSAAVVRLSADKGTLTPKVIFKNLDANLESISSHYNALVLSADGKQAIVGAAANIKGSPTISLAAASVYDLRLYALSLESGSGSVFASLGRNDMDFLDTIAERPDGGYCVGGRTRSTNLLTVDTPVNTKTEIDGLLIGVAANGAQQWSVRFGVLDKPNNSEYVYSVVGLADGGCLASTALADGSTQIVRIDSSGKITAKQSFPGQAAMRMLDAQTIVSMDYNIALHRLSVPASGPVVESWVSPPYQALVPGALTLLAGGAAVIGGHLNDSSSKPLHGGYLTVDGFGHSQCMKDCGKVGPTGCADSNPCTLDLRLAGKGCSSSILPDGPPCGEGKVCKSALCQ